VAASADGNESPTPRGVNEGNAERRRPGTVSWLWDDLFRRSKPRMHPNRSRSRSFNSDPERQRLQGTRTRPPYFPHP